jgi:hypothetical protein
MSDQDYFISIDQPDDLRRRLLESSKGVIVNLKDYHALQSIRKNKLDMITLLQQQLKELAFLMDKLNQALPDKQIDYEKELYEQKVREEAEEKKKAEIQRLLDEKKKEEQRAALIKMQEQKNIAAQAALRALDQTRQAAEVQQSRKIEPPRPQIQQRIPIKPAQPKPIQDNPAVDIDRLSKALSNIEDKLNKL